MPAGRWRGHRARKPGSGRSIEAAPAIQELARRYRCRSALRQLRVGPGRPLIVHNDRSPSVHTSQLDLHHGIRVIGGQAHRPRLRVRWPTSRGTPTCCPARVASPFQRLQNGRFAASVRAEQQRERCQGQRALPQCLEIRELDGFDHGAHCPRAARARTHTAPPLRIIQRWQPVDGCRPRSPRLYPTATPRPRPSCGDTAACPNLSISPCELPVDSLHPLRYAKTRPRGRSCRRPGTASQSAANAPRMAGVSAIFTFRHWAFPARALPEQVAALSLPAPVLLSHA